MTEHEKQLTEWVVLRLVYEWRLEIRNHPDIRFPNLPPKDLDPNATLAGHRQLQIDMLIMWLCQARNCSGDWAGAIGNIESWYAPGHEPRFFNGDDSEIARTPFDNYFAMQKNRNAK